MKVTGSELVARALGQHDVGKLFFIMGGPINDAANACGKAGIGLVDVRHEQAAAMMAQAYARVLGRPGVCMAASGPGTINLTTGLANALIDCAPVVALGGSSPISQRGIGAFQDVDQLAIMRPVTKWAERVHETRRIPELVAMAFRQALSGKPGPVFLDLPGDVLYGQVEEEDVVWPQIYDPRDNAPATSQGKVDAVIDLLRSAKRPIILSGSGVLWGKGEVSFQNFIHQTGIPFYTTPQGRGVVPEDHEFFYAHARSTAFKEADLVIVAGTRLNYVFSHGRSPRFAPDAKFVRIDVDAAELSSTERLAVGIVGDVGTVLEQLSAALETAGDRVSYENWRDRLATIEAQRAPDAELKMSTDQVPIHPLRLCKEIRDFIDRDTILVVDGQEILNYGRQSIPSFKLGHRLNSGPFGTMGVGLPFGVGAKVAKPDHKVVVLHGDGSFGLNAMELDTAVRHGLPILIVISLNGGWTADPEKIKPGRDLGYTRFDKFAEIFGCYGEYVERPEDIAAALRRGAEAVAGGRSALINVVTDWKARAGTASFTAYTT
ncbi:MAG TPA: thiamine pyrophosphate-binding protein [Devosia sp.]|nr:thiamine pyrophosphate-binding protein [Devosia sp.]